MTESLREWLAGWFRRMYGPLPLPHGIDRERYERAVRIARVTRYTVQAVYDALPIFESHEVFDEREQQCMIAAACAQNLDPTAMLHVPR